MINNLKWSLLLKKNKDPDLDNCSSCTTLSAKHHSKSPRKAKEIMKYNTLKFPQKVVSGPDLDMNCQIKLLMTDANLLANDNLQTVCCKLTI